MKATKQEWFLSKLNGRGTYQEPKFDEDAGKIVEFYQDHGFTASVLSPEQFPLQPATLDDLLGGDGADNARLLQRLLEGEDQGPKRDAVLLNAAAALFVAGRAKTILAGWAAAAELIDSGRALAKLDELVHASRLVK